MAIDDIALLHLDEVSQDQLVKLMNHPRVGQHLPLLAGGFTAERCRAFVHAKAQIWREHGYGPWAFVVGGELAGWGGLQPENGDADFALVLHPKFWGLGRRIFERIRDDTFGRMGLDSLTILLPPSRPNSRAVTRLGFVADGEVDVGGELFLRFRLHRPR